MNEYANEKPPDILLPALLTGCFTSFMSHLCTCLTYIPISNVYLSQLCTCLTEIPVSHVYLSYLQPCLTCVSIPPAYLCTCAALRITMPW